MALSFPLSKASFADLLKIERVQWNLLRFEEQAIYGSGEWLTAELAPPLWEAQCETVSLENDDAHQVRALINAIGTSGTAYVWNPSQPGPKEDKTGSSYGSSTPTIASINANRRDLAITGLPASYVLSPGDLFEVSYSSPARRALLEVVLGVTANGSGVTAQFTVSPAIRAGITTGDSVNFIKPAAKMKLVPGSDQIMSDGRVRSRVRFTFRQTLAAD